MNQLEGDALSEDKDDNADQEHYYFLSATICEMSGGRV